MNKKDICRVDFSLRGLLAVLIAIIIAITVLPGNLLKQGDFTTEVSAATTLNNPKIVSDNSMESGQKVTWDCVWFGSYPQTEIVDQANRSGVYGKIWVQDSDYEVNVTLYNSLQTATGWDNNGDITLNGVKYRRINAYDATFADQGYDPDIENASMYSWNDLQTYHYFRYDPIKWRVLNVADNSKLFLLSDVALDDIWFDIKDPNNNINITWSNSRVRSWLNGYDNNTNIAGVDYRNKNFINSAFTSSEKNAIINTALDNKTTGPYSEQTGGDNTSDKVFLLSSYDVYHSSLSGSYGFYKDSYELSDEARQSKSSTFAKAMGTWSRIKNETWGGGKKQDVLGNCYWWLRSPLENGYNLTPVCFDGTVRDAAGDYRIHGVRPAINLDATQSVWSYAGTVCSDGTVKDNSSSNKHSHNLVKTNETKATCTMAGNSAYWYCAGCDNYFSDEKGENVIRKDSWIIQPSGHKLIYTPSTPATTTSAGNNAYYTCSTCGKYFSDSAGSNEIDKDSWIIQKLEANPESTTTPPAAPTQPNTPTTVPAPATGKEEITVSKTPASIKVKVNKNKVTVSWKKIKMTKKTKKIFKKIKGIQVQFSTDKKFNQNVTNKKIGKNKTKVTFKPKKKTTYYVRVRYYAKGGVSKWCKTKKVKVK